MSFAIETVSRTAHKVWNEIGDGIRSAREQVMELSVDKSSDILAGTVLGIVDDIKEDTVGVVTEVAEKLDPENLGGWNRIKESVIDGNSSFFSRVWGRLLWAGARIGSTISAIFVDKWAGTNNQERNIPLFERIYSALFANIFKKKNIAKV